MSHIFTVPEVIVSLTLQRKQTENTLTPDEWFPLVGLTLEDGATICASGCLAGG